MSLLLALVCAAGVAPTAPLVDAVAVPFVASLVDEGAVLTLAVSVERSVSTAESPSLPADSALI